ncbi:MAG: acyltransferase [Mycobacteriales bacterium]
MRDRYVPGVHAARALAVTLVLAAHIIGIWGNLQGARWFLWQAWLVGVVDVLRFDDQAGGHFGLLIFFLLSGYIVSQAAEDDGVTAFVVKRAARLIPAMAIAVGFTMLVASIGRARGWTPVSEFNADRAFSGWTVLEAFGLGPTFGGLAALGVLWSLSVEYYWYAILAVLIAPARRWPAATTAVMVAIVYWLYQLPAATSDRTPQIARGHLPYVLIVLMGRWVYLGHRRVTSWLVAAAGGLATTAVFVAMQRTDAELRVLFGTTKPRMLSLAWAVLVFSLLLRFVRSGPWKPVAFIGDISYGLYLFHIPVMFLVLPIISPGGRLMPVGVVVTVTATVALAWLSLRFVEIPLRRRARALLGRRSEPVLEDTKSPVAHPAL